MGPIHTKLWDIVTGRSTRRGPNLDNLFALPSAAITLQTGLGLTPTGVGAVCFRAASGAAMSTTQADVEALIETNAGPSVERSVDAFGFTWLVIRGTADDLSGLVTDVHAVNTALESQGFGESLLCSMVDFAAADADSAAAAAAAAAARRLGLVYLYKHGTFYPFAPSGDKSRDALFERQVRDAVAADLTIEPDASRWLPLWGAPGL